MGLIVLPQVQQLLTLADASSEPLDLLDLAGKCSAVIGTLGTLSPDERRGDFAVVGALYFASRRGNGNPVWDMYWQPSSSFTTAAGETVHSPDYRLATEEVVAYWGALSKTLIHPVLRARYGDLAWETSQLSGKIARTASAAAPARSDIAWAQAAIDGYLDAVARRLAVDDHRGAFYLERAVELALQVNDAARVERSKRLLFTYQADCAARGPSYAFWIFDDIAWNNGRKLSLTPGERAVIVAELERILAMRADFSNPDVFDPHLALAAADRLRRWHELDGQNAEARRASSSAGAAFEQASANASALTAIAWLSDQLRRYRDAGDIASATRVEQTIRQRAPEMQGEMRRVSVPIQISPDELQAIADHVAGDSLEDAMRRFAAAGLIREKSTTASLRMISEQAPLLAAIQVSLVGDNGFPTAIAGSIESDPEGRAIQHAAQLAGWFAPMLNVALDRIRVKHGLALDTFMAWLADAPLFPASRHTLTREGVGAWFAGDHVKAIHVLVPQIEAAIRELLVQLGGSIMRPDYDSGGFLVISLGQVLSDPVLIKHIPSDLRFHFRVLFQDPRGINLRNEVAHALAPPELFQRGASNWVIHAIIMLGQVRVTRVPSATAPPHCESSSLT